MIRLLSPAGKILAAFNVLLVLVLSYELSAPQSAPNLPPLPRIRHSVPQFVSYSAPNAQAFDEIDRRPLFVASRRPPKAANESAANAPPPPPELTLVGIISGGRSQIALAKSHSAPNAVTLSVGSSIDGWEVTAIESDRIVLHAAAADYEVRLRAKPGEPVIALVRHGDDAAGTAARETDAEQIR